MPDTLREYLIGLGWKIDESSWKKYEGALLRTGEATFKVGATALATATAVEAMVTRVARQYENLYYVSQRSGQSVQYLQTTQFGFKQIGLSAEDATDAIEGVSQAIRMNPGLSGLVKGETDVNKIIDQFTKLPDAVGLRLASLYGISYKVYMQRKLFGKIEDEQAESLKKLQRDTGVNSEQLAKDSKELGLSLNELDAVFGNMESIIAQNFVVPMKDSVCAIVDFLKWIEKSDPTLKVFGHTIHGVGETIAFLGGTGLGIGLLKKLLTRILAAVGVLKATEAAAVSVGTTAGAGAAATAGAGAGAAAAAGGAGITIAGGLASGGFIAGSIALLEAMKNDKDHSLRSRLRAVFGIDETEEERNAPDPSVARAQERDRGLAPLDIRAPLSLGSPLGFAEPDRSSDSGSAQDRLRRTIKFFEDQGYSRNSAAGIAASLYYESGRTLDPKAKNMAGGGEGAHGVEQWRGERLNEFRRLYGKNVQDASLYEQLQFVLYELRKGKDVGARQAGDELGRGDLSSSKSAERFLRLSVRPGPAGEDEIKNASNLAGHLSSLVPQQTDAGDRTVNVNQKTEIHVTGVGAEETASKVVGAQSRVNDQVVRNTVNAFR